VRWNAEELQTKKTLLWKQCKLAGMSTVFCHVHHNAEIHKCADWNLMLTFGITMCQVEKRVHNYKPFLQRLQNASQNCNMASQYFGTHKLFTTHDFLSHSYMIQISQFLYTLLMEDFYVHAHQLSALKILAMHILFCVASKCVKSCTQTVHHFFGKISVIFPEFVAQLWWHLVTYFRSGGC